MRLFIAAIWLFLSVPALAEVQNKPYEIQLAPSVGYSNFTGLQLGLHGELAIGVDQHWQLLAGGRLFTNKFRPASKFILTMGARYNFSEDWTRSLYIDAGAGYGDTRGISGNDHATNTKGMIGYMTIGKRIPLNNSGTFSWVPNASYTFGDLGSHTGELSISPLTFSYSF